MAPRTSRVGSNVDGTPNTGPRPSSFAPSANQPPQGGSKASGAAFFQGGGPKAPTVVPVVDKPDTPSMDDFSRLFDTMTFKDSFVCERYVEVRDILKVQRDQGLLVDSLETQAALSLFRQQYSSYLPKGPSTLEPVHPAAKEINISNGLSEQAWLDLAWSHWLNTEHLLHVKYPDREGGYTYCSFVAIARRGGTTAWGPTQIYGSGGHCPILAYLSPRPSTVAPQSRNATYMHGGKPPYLVLNFTGP